VKVPAADPPWLLLAPTKTDTQIINGNPLAIGSWLGLAQARDKLYGFEDGAIGVWTKNSAVYAFGVGGLILATAIPAGYGLALTRFIGRRTLLTITSDDHADRGAGPAGLPGGQRGAPGRDDLVGDPAAVVFPFGVYLTYIYFSTTIPAEILAAARIDGCSEWQVFAKVALPLAKPVVALVGCFSFVGSWNNFFLPFVMLPDSKQYPAQVGLNDLLAFSQVFDPSAASGIGRPEIALAAIVTILPVLVVFLFSQRALVSGMLAGAAKG
jgi:multiple sugar transport system permease protein